MEFHFSLAKPPYLVAHVSGFCICIACLFTCIFISKSKEFADALSLSQHASQTLGGLRAEHLGLHKALCWLMGWSSEAAPNGLWIRRILPLVEVLALKEDLIIWPPVLIIHNSSIAIDNLSERVAISCEELEVVIRGKPFLCCNYELLVFPFLIFKLHVDGILFKSSFQVNQDVI